MKIASLLLFGSIIITQSMPAQAMYKSGTWVPEATNNNGGHWNAKGPMTSAPSAPVVTHLPATSMPWASAMNPWLGTSSKSIVHSSQSAKSQSDVQDKLREDQQKSIRKKEKLDRKAEKEKHDAEHKKRESEREIEKQLERDAARKKDIEDTQESAQQKEDLAKVLRKTSKVNHEICKSGDDICEKMKAKRESIQAEKAERLAQAAAFCFSGETPIAVKDDSPRGYHSKSISSIRIGDTVVSCNLALNGGTCELGQVQKVIQNTADHLIKLTISGKTLKATDNHPFYVVDHVSGKDWIDAQDLRVGDHLLSISGDVVTLDDREIEKGDVTVYNLDVRGNHNYYACDVLVHNCNVTTATEFGESVLGGIFSGAIPIAIPIPSMEEIDREINRFKAANSQRGATSGANTFTESGGDSVGDIFKGTPSHSDFKPQKNWNGQKVKNPNGPGSGYPAKNGDVWVPTTHKGTHAPHWDVQHPDGSHTNVYPK